MRPITIPEIERRLRVAAPDEPPVLPPLALPIGAATVSRAAVRLRPGAAQGHGLRPAYAALLLLLGLAAVVAAGAVRLLDQSRVDPLAQACSPMSAVFPDDTQCRPVNVPAGWYELGAGQLQSGDFTEQGLGYQLVTLVMANVPLGGCPSPGGPMPMAVPSGSDGSVQPYPTPDPGLACVRATTLPDNGIRVVTMFGSRIAGVDEQGAGIPDTSEPTPESGWTEVVDGRPARLTVTSVDRPGRAEETRTWDILRPGSIDGVLRITADIAGPDLDAGRAEVQRLIDAVDFRWAPPPLEDSDRDEVLRAVVDFLERDARERHSDLYGCFPREPGMVEGTITRTDAGPLATPLDVRCSSSIQPSRAGVWRIQLDISWEATDGHPGDTIRQELFSTGERYENGAGNPNFSGGYWTSLAGRPMAPSGVGSWFPNSSFELPPPLTGPLNIPAGSLVEVLWPGAALHVEPEGHEAGYPASVGTHLYVIDGPTVIDGDEWYRVEAAALLPELHWVPGTLDGRPLLEVAQPECPSGAVTVGDVTWLIPAERLLCFGGGEITFEQAVIEPEEGFGAECSMPDGGIGPCPTETGDAAWITGRPWWLFGEGGRAGPAPGFLVWLDPSIAAPATGQPVRIRGHWDDPAAAACRTFETIGPSGFTNPDAGLRELFCRERFVVTSIEPLG